MEQGWTYVVIGCELPQCKVISDGAIEAAKAMLAVTSHGRRALAVAVAVAADVSDEQSAGAAVQRVADELGPPVVLVNNAGVLRNGLMFTMSVADRDAVLDVNLRAAS